LAKNSIAIWNKIVYVAYLFNIWFGRIIIEIEIDIAIDIKKLKPNYT